MDTNAFIQCALHCGADKAVVIPRIQVVCSASFREICRSNGCGCYGRCWTCPPQIGEIDVLMRSLDAYSHVLWYQSIARIEDSFDIEGMLEAGHAHALLSQRIENALRDTGMKNRLHLSCGGCRLCERCAMRDGLPCRHPEKALASLEGYGVDVYKTTKQTDLHYINGKNTVTYFGAVFFSEE